MKNDRYLRVILTIIAICLVWICVRDIQVGGKNVFASGPASGQGLGLVHIIEFGQTACDDMERAFSNALIINQPLRVIAVAPLSTSEK